MKRSERTYDQLFGVLRDTPTAASLTTEEIRSLIEKETGGIVLPPTRGIMARRIARAAGLLAMVVIAVRVGWPAGDQAGRTRAARSMQPSTAPPSETMEQGPAKVWRTPAEEPVEGIEDTHRLAAASATFSIPGGTSGESRHDRHGESSVAPSRASSGTRATPASRSEESSDPTTSLSPAQRPSDISTLPMLELSPEELASLGVTFADGGIQTVCEEYYTLATDQDRSTFARMGIDTTQRSGIVRMHLSIDTFNLTTRKHGWARVEDYSRIAPVIVLSSHFRNEHDITVSVASFKRSPIMASARSSIDSMVTFLPTALASGNVDRVMHDSDQSNPARILVPVHIRLGDALIAGSMKRRGADIILWYYPTPEFAAALPPRYRTPLQRELNVLADVVECNLPQREACRQLTGEPLLVNYCRRTSGALSGLNVSPNPAHDEIRMRYMLESQRTMTVALYGIRGEFVRELIPATPVPAGMRSESVRLGDVRPGAYMVVLRSDQGEHVSERLIVQ
jgi:hypothetical protein